MTEGKFSLYCLVLVFGMAIGAAALWLSTPIIGQCHCGVTPQCKCVPAKAPKEVP